MNSSGLFSDFPEVSSKAWKQKIQYDLQGKDYNQSLVWESPEGIKVKPFYHQDEELGDEQNNPNRETDWKIGESIYAENAEQTNIKAKESLENGAESLHFTIPSQVIAFHTLVKNIDLKKTALYCNLQFLSPTYVNAILDTTEKHGGQVFLNIDIVGHLAKTGNWYNNLKKDHNLLGEIIKEGHPNTLSVDASLYANAGANMVQQLAYAMAQANEYLNFLNNSHKDYLKKAVLTFKVSVGSNYFFEIAKLRALRVLYQTLSSEYGALDRCHIIAIPSRRNKTLYDHNNNLLRSTTECMSAIVGGADSLLNLPYDVIYNKDNEFGKRLARNQLLILKEESFFNKVNNPSEGAYYIESITQQLASKALDLFKQIEAGGGFLVQLKEHIIQKKIKESAAKEQQLFKEQGKILVGTNKHATRKDKMKNKLERYPFVKTNTRKTLIEPIIERRLAEEWEKERLRQE